MNAGARGNPLLKTWPPPKAGPTYWQPKLPTRRFFAPAALGRWAALGLALVLVLVLVLVPVHLGRALWPCALA